MTHAEARAVVVDLAYDRADLGALLMASKGDGYRPYIVAAIVLLTSKNTKRVTRAGDVNFTESTVDAAENLLKLQAVQDLSIKQIPAGWTVEAVRSQVGGEVYRSSVIPIEVRL